MLLRTPILTALAVATLTLTGCAGLRGGHDGHGDMDRRDGDRKGGGMMGGGMMMGGMAVATLSPTQGSNVRGLVMFHTMDDHLMVHAKVSGLTPGAAHGFHVHENGSCASPDGSSAGGHFNPDGKPHGPQNAAHHAGDMPSLKADANGVADLKFMMVGPTIPAGPTSLVGRSVIVHAQPDDYATQPTGNSGARLACGVIAGH